MNEIILPIKCSTVKRIDDLLDEIGCIEIDILSIVSALFTILFFYSHQYNFMVLIEGLGYIFITFVIWFIELALGNYQRYFVNFPKISCIKDD